MAQLIFRREKVYRQRTTPPSKDFKALYRFEERNVEWLGSHFLGDSHERRGGALSSKERMQVFLRYMGDPGFQKGIGEEIKIDQSTVSRTILHVSQKILEKADLWIQLPTEQTIAREKELWQHKYQFPTCIGAIDCKKILVHNIFN
uniref:Uncharacterized protein n=1 Tax=Cacopsylla melanoneura TaxID=428564 RepID=A0A8D9E4B2_9HEMI